MCTALTLTSKDGFHFFGRNMDIDYNFNQSVIFVPRNLDWENVVNGESNKTKYALLGMGTLMNNHPLLADGMNEKGLGCAGLNFLGFAHFEENRLAGKVNLGPYDLMLWILSNFGSVSEVKSALEEVNLINKPFAPKLPVPTLHWMVHDKNEESIVIETTPDRIAVYDNKIGVLTNQPAFDWHIMNLNQYMALSPMQPETTTWHKQQLEPIGNGLGLKGLPGDFYPSSRFVRSAFLKNHAAFLDTKESTISEFFHILGNVAPIGGSVITQEGKQFITLYSSCMCLENGVYYYNTYNNSQINAIDMFKEDLDGHEIKVFKYPDTQAINFQN
ncbi:choloylglycine hydrolase [Paenibacillus segetis]|uniref:choloylglycine hydrolase n=1 Tax=Paenibacillus segetis TaxID=1325360 RepID=A0ABQ1YL78_9BACL|nr:choloylglycine hydrolase [Paenibacillus segetis]GGH30259.1 choloylglycine hydrolase [Paenibacillus segetis]